MVKKNSLLFMLVFCGLFVVSCEHSPIDEWSSQKPAGSKPLSNLLLEETFEGDIPLSGFHGTEFSAPHAFSVVDWPVFDGKKAARIELRESDPLESNATRAEIVAIKDKMQKEMWFSFAVYLPAADFAYDSHREIISQWHQTGGASPPSFLLIYKDHWRFEVSNIPEAHVEYDLGKIAKNQWHHFTFHFIQSYGDDGLVEVWHNDNQVLTHRGGNIYNLANLPKWKLGIYKWEWNPDQASKVNKRVLYLDNIRIGKAGATLSEMTASNRSWQHKTGRSYFFENQ